MPEYLSPGVYVEEISTGPRPIEGVGTSTAGFIGGAERGPEAPSLVTSWLDYQRWYGSYVPDTSYLAYAIQGFFDNGGQPETFIDPTDPANATNPERREPDVLEVFDNLSAQEGASNNVKTVLNSNSRLVVVDWTTAGPAVLPPQAFTGAVFDNGADGAAVILADYVGDMNVIPGGLAEELLGRGRGLEALATVDEVALLLAPDEVRAGLEPNLSLEVIKQCELLKDRFGVVSASQGQRNFGVLRPIQDTSYAGFYYPWIEIFDPSINTTRLIPPSGHVAGIMARTDVERGVHKAPANEVVRDAVGLEFPLTKGIQDILNPRGVNCVRDFRSNGRGIRLWGARTMSSDALWKYVNVRRLFIFVEESIDEGTQWVVFEPNDQQTWGYVRRSISNFLTRVWKNGALMGTTQDEAFFVHCDDKTMTQDDIDNGRLICYIGIAPVKPAEFVIFRISQKTAMEVQA